MTKVQFAVTIVIIAWIACGPSDCSRVKAYEAGDLLQPFHVKDCTGPAAGKTLCYGCRFGSRPVICLLTRQWSREVETLVQRIDRYVAANRSQRMAAFVVYVAEDSRDAEAQLRRAAIRLDLRWTPLTIYRDTEEKLDQTLQLSRDEQLTWITWCDGRIRTQREAPAAGLTELWIRHLGQDMNALAAD